MNILTNEKTLKDLEYGKLKEILQSFAVSPMGRELVAALRPSAEYETIERELDRVEELCAAITQARFALSALPDIRPLLQQARQTTSLSGEEFLLIGEALGHVRQTRERLLALDEQPHLRELGERLEVFRELEENIFRVFDEDGEIRESASPTLRELITRQRVLEERVQRRLQALIQSGQLSGILQDTLITRRSGRLVIPIKSSARHELDAVVHDSSDSGQTLYIEPHSVVEENNQIRELEGEIRDEKLRIVRELTQRLQAESRKIEETLRVIAYLDLLYAKAQFALHFHCYRPQLRRDGQIHLIAARHPLLNPETVVPIEVKLGEPFQGIVITGPNTGGKTVALKTVGLLTLMAHSGIPIPAAPDSSLMLCEKVFSDIGDEQSIQQNLSTFSAHLKNLLKILQHADAQTLVLIDELGAGTDPTEGAALGIAILETLLQRGAKILATTHFSAIKHFAYRHPKLKTCSVEFDVETLTPTFRLVEGIGASNAFAIAERLGLPHEILQRARAHLAEGQVHVEEIIAKLERERSALAQEHERVSQHLRELEAQKREYAERLNQVRARKEEALTQELRQIEKQLKEARTALEEALHRAKQTSDESQLREALKRVHGVGAELAQASQQLRVESQVEVPWRLEELSAGVRVQLRDSKRLGTVRQVVSAERIEVELDGGVRLWAKLSDLVQPTTAKPNEQERRRMRVFVDTTTTAAPPPELDLRGLTVSEALRQIDLYLDKLLLTGLKRGRLLHGKGTGVLRREIRKHLATLSIVKSFESAPPNQGGDGVTIVELG
ncbi:MAG: endonuclease MutS2 [Candidatus Bipolaricaulota bacterium]|nr:endonuclease MutS2 [Candidatus Bipolaricaulota bacterium]MCS7274202.1 endonuclease MutS2 [Candidatus Bipolaricaulota bacterium]MDW8110632.1 endonuclease MutS2 [Candidatus Bipolaricaulota bacterium]MDW8328510.1 endonuclease MutS2 [Candidatus Bipolaricaulota bacterium]